MPIADHKETLFPRVDVASPTPVRGLFGHCLRYDLSVPGHLPPISKEALIGAITHFSVSQPKDSLHIAEVGVGGACFS